MAQSHIPDEVLLKILHEVEDFQTLKILRLANSVFSTEALCQLFSTVHASLLDGKSLKRFWQLSRSQHRSLVKVVALCVKPSHLDASFQSNLSNDDRSRLVELWPDPVRHTRIGDSDLISRRFGNNGPGLPVCSPRRLVELLARFELLREVQYDSRSFTGGRRAEHVHMLMLLAVMSSTTLRKVRTLDVRVHRLSCFSFATSRLERDAPSLSVCHLLRKLRVCALYDDDNEHSVGGAGLYYSDLTEICPNVEHLCIFGDGNLIQIPDLFLPSKSIECLELSNCRIVTDHWRPSTHIWTSNKLSGLRLHNVVLHGEHISSFCQYLANMPNLRFVRLSNITRYRLSCAASGKCNSPRPEPDGMGQVVISGACRGWMDGHALRDLFMQVGDNCKGGTSNPDEWPFEEIRAEREAMQRAERFYMDNFGSLQEYDSMPEMSDRRHHDEQHHTAYLT